jgi:hypothetical protein
MSEQPYGPGAICSNCGHWAHRHGPEVREGKRGRLPGCDVSDLIAKGIADKPCRCRGMLWDGQRWPRPWLPAPEGLRCAD